MTEPKEVPQEPSQQDDLLMHPSVEGFRFSHTDESGNKIWISVGDGDSQITTDEYGHRLDEE